MIYINNFQDIKIDIELIKEFSDFIITNHLLKENKSYELSITLLNDKDIKEYNKKYLNHDYPTDVIAFPLKDELNNKIILGDILINPEYIKRYAKENNIDFEKEFLFVIAHGILHIFDYKDYTKEQKEEMFKLQNTLIKEFENAKSKS